MVDVCICHQLLLCVLVEGTERNKGVILEMFRPDGADLRILHPALIVNISFLV